MLLPIVLDEVSAGGFDLILFGRIHRDLLPTGIVDEGFDSGEYHSESQALCDLFRRRHLLQGQFMQKISSFDSSGCAMGIGFFSGIEVKRKIQFYNHPSRHKMFFRHLIMV